MQKIYSVQSTPAIDAESNNMKSPRMSTINFLRNFARAYGRTTMAGTIIYN